MERRPSHLWSNKSKERGWRRKDHSRGIRGSVTCGGTRGVEINRKKEEERRRKNWMKSRLICQVGLLIIKKKKRIKWDWTTVLFSSFGHVCAFFLCGCRMGYDLERFVGYVNDGLLCCVCRDVLERPLQAPCEHAYCCACISSWLVHHHSCPEDRLPLDVGSLKPLYRSASVSAHMSVFYHLLIVIVHSQGLHFLATIQWGHPFILLSLISPMLFLSLITGTCVTTWTVCRYAVWMQGRAVRWCAPWRACTHMRMSASLPSYRALTQVWNLTQSSSNVSFCYDYR